MPLPTNKPTVPTAPRDDAPIVPPKAVPRDGTTGEARGKRVRYIDKDLAECYCGTYFDPRLTATCWLCNGKGMDHDPSEDPLMLELPEELQLS